MLASPVINSKFIYQYGNAPGDLYIFYKGGFNKLIKSGIKEVTETSAFIDGDVDLMQKKRSKKESYLLDVDFTSQYSAQYSIDYINKIFMGEPRYGFFFDYESKADDKYKIAGIKRFYYNPHLRTVKPPDLAESERENRYEGEYQASVVLKMNKPYFYDCTLDLEYINYEQYLQGQSKWDEEEWDTGWWDALPGTLGQVSSLSNDEKLAFFSNLPADKANFFLALKDRFFARDTTQTNRNYVVNSTVAGDAQADFSMGTSFDESNARNQIYRLEFSPLGTNQSLTISNLSNNTGIKIKWLATTNSADLVFNSYYGKLYEGVNETEVPSSKYTIEAVGQEALYMTGKYNPFPVIDLNPEIIRVITSPGGSVTVKLDVLITYD